ncbi:hypothetical protein H7F15_07980 [Pontibacter sp. Tf4]|uniref:hypothetical protein n=1 Tax=Pontibacter sp. Tf4 TaxID=2761620 RepID=UPI001629A017|nr:hypothetical protein [Pontibacter sp. Tf4]MBB6610971.1 hypothetical protein [Pontibacter sp. Tf4]
MKIIVLLSACFVGFNFACQDAASVVKPAAPATVVISDVEEPVATITLDTVVIVGERPVSLAGL